MPILLKNHIGKGHKIFVTTNLTEKVSGDGTLQFEILENINTYDIITSISKMWTVTKVSGDNDLNEYRIVMLDRSTKGNKQVVNVTARQKEIDDLMNYRHYENYTGSFTAATYFESIFRGTGYKYKLTTKPSSSRWENAGDGDTAFEMFQKGLDRYGLEYSYDAKTKTFTLTPFYENKTEYYISTEINANNLKLEEDGSEMYTYIRGYGGFEEGEDFREGAIQIEFTHPMADVVGKRQAPPVIDGRITNITTMKKKLETIIEASFKTSLSLDFIALREKFPKATPRIGDVVPVKSTIMDIQEGARIIEVNTKRDPYNEIMKQDIVLGDASRAERYFKSVNQAANLASGLGGGNTGVKTIRTISTDVAKSSNVSKEVARSTQSVSYTDEGIKTSGNGSTLVFGNGVINGVDDKNSATEIVNSNGINPMALPKASKSSNGVITPEEKLKLNQIDEGKITLTGNDGKQYALQVINGALKVAVI